MQDNVAKTQEEISRIQIEGQAGGGLVKLLMNGKHQIIKLSIDNSLVNDDKDMLEDLVAATVNDATNKIDKASKDKYAELIGDINLPGGGGFQMPF